MTARVLVIGLDAAEATLLERWAADGELPNLARLARQGAVAALDNPMESLPGAIWPEICSGRSAGKAGLFYHPEQVHTGEAVLRPVEHDEVDPTDNYWSVASDAGCRVCVVDQVQAVVNPRLNGVQLLEWGLHDRTFDERSHPAGLLDEIRRRYGIHPVRRCDAYGDDERGRQALLDDLVEGVRLKRALALDLMANEQWDLFACTLAECHCVGHHFWACQDPDTPGNDFEYPPAHRDAMRTIYRLLDEVVGALIESAGPGATTLVIASHGMGPSHAGYHMLPEILARLGMSSGRGAAVRFPLRRLQTRIKNTVPPGWVPALRALCRLGPVKALQGPTGALRFGLESPDTRAVAVPNNRVGAIRLNLKGREPQGAVAPGPEADALLTELGRELLALEDPASGEPVVDRVLRADEAFGPDRHPDVPDLMVVFRTGHGPIEAVRSDRVGLIELPYFTPRTHRTGDHTVQSRLWAAGPGIPAGARPPRRHVLDIAPTVLQRLKVGVPPRLDGRPITFETVPAARVG